MGEVESREDFAERIKRGVLNGFPERYNDDHWAWYLDELAKRDAAIRAEVWREAEEILLGWADGLAGGGDYYTGKEAAYRAAADHFRALAEQADKEPSDE